jgi:endoglycosylceramidase
MNARMKSFRVLSLSARGLGIAVFCWLSACQGAREEAAPEGPAIERPQRFITDAQGRALILRGMNVSNESKGSSDHQPSITEPEVAQMSTEYGFRFVRHLIFWGAVEPQQGVFDDAYLDQVEVKLDAYEAHGVRVMLDMHQDIFSFAPTWGNGAPPWAVQVALDGELPTLDPVSSWSNAYFLPSVTTAFDRFFGYEEPYRVLQDRYAASWQHVAERFRDHPAVIGYDVMNEPFPGSAWDPLEVGLSGFESTPSYEFDRTHFADFYERMIAAIREIDEDHFIFYEPRFGAPGNGSRSYLPPLDDPRVGEPRLAYAPHMYSVSYEANAEYRPWSDRSVERFEAARALEIREHDVPLVIGEWGLDQGGIGGLLLTEKEADSFDRLNAGWAYWSYDPGNGPSLGWNPFYRTGTPSMPLGENPNADILVRMYPLATAGQIVSFDWDRATRTFTLVFDSVAGVTDVAATEIFLPNERFFPNDFVVLIGDPSSLNTSSSFDDATNVLSVLVDPSVPRHVVTVMPRDYLAP